MKREFQEKEKIDKNFPRKLEGIVGFVFSSFGCILVSKEELKIGKFNH